MAEAMKIGKSQFTDDVQLQYCTEHSYKLQPTQQKLMEATLHYPMGRMMGAVEVIQMCSVLMKRLNAKNALDVGLFTGFSALSWALVVPEDGKVVSMDVSDKAYNEVGKKLVEEAGVAHKIDVRIQPALKTLDDLIANGQSGTFDFAFIDAQKDEYPQYYDKCMQLMRSGGFIAVDNALGVFWKAPPQNKPPPQPASGDIGNMAFNPDGPKRIDELNKTIASDSRVHAVLLPIANGLHLAFKK